MSDYKFKVGDKVRQAKRESPYGAYNSQGIQVGDYVGEVVEIDYQGTVCPVRVRYPFDKPNEASWPFRDEELTLVERPEPEAEKVHLVIGVECDDFIVLDVVYANKEDAVARADALNAAETDGTYYWYAQGASVQR